MDIVERFIAYTKINVTDRQKDAEGIMPSSPNQMDLAKLLESELKVLGLQNVIRRENAITTALIPGNTKAPSIAFFGHLDTSCKQVNDTHANITHY